MGRLERSNIRTVLLLAVLMTPVAQGSAQEAGEFLRFPDSVEAYAPGGRLRSEDVTAALARAEALIAKGHLRMAGATLDLVEARAGATVPKLADLRTRIRQVEFSSIVVLRDGRRIVGRLTGPFRADRLGLGTKNDIFPDAVRRISVEYHLGWSAVSNTFYPLTVTETEFDDGHTLVGRFTQETPITVETSDGRLLEMKLGRAYELFRDEGLAKQILRDDGDRVARILIYPILNPPAP